MHQIFRRIVLDLKTMRWERFIIKWQGFQDLIEEAQNYWEAYMDVI